MLKSFICGAPSLRIRRRLSAVCTSSQMPRSLETAYTIQSKSIFSIYQAHRAPGALTCRMVSEGRLTSNEIASNSDYDSMPRKPPVSLGTLKKKLYPYYLPRATTLALQLLLQLAGVSTLNSWQLSHRLAVSSTTQLPSHA